MGLALVLDAMGVIYQSADDVAELLVPFVAEQGGLADHAAIEELYVRASLGQLTAEQFWRAVGVSPELEGKYLARHKLNDGLVDFLGQLPPLVDQLWCLSNDVAEWSKELRERHKLSDHFAGFVISGDVGSRKPEERIFRELLARIGRPADQCVLIDDRVKNLRAAKAIGFQTIGFGTIPSADKSIADTWVKSFAALAKVLGNPDRHGRAM